MSVYAVILCGGSGTRMGAAENKTLLPIGGTPALIRSLTAFQGLVQGVVLVVRAGEEARFRAVLAAYHQSVYALTPGGADRQESALCGLRALPKDAEYALIHDGARPFVSREVIARVLESTLARGSGVAAVAARDTIKRAQTDGRVLETPDRASLYQVQTPQGFRVSALLAAHAGAAARYTDDAALMEAAGYPVYLTPGDYRNIKLTSPEDLRMANNLLFPRVGHGCDAHRLVPGRELWLGGAKIPYEKGLLGHSDADAALHALMDALLGAAGLPNIGQLFPDSAEEYRGVSSLKLLREVGRRLTEAGFSLGNCDVTIIAQAPKLSPYLAEMRRQTAAALGVSEGQVSYKATTTEGMGFEGAGEGISAHAVALLFQMDGR